MADELWVSTWGIDHEGMPYADPPRKLNPKKDSEAYLRIQKRLHPTQEAAISYCLAGLEEEKAALVDAFDKVMAKLLAP